MPMSAIDASKRSNIAFRSSIGAPPPYLFALIAWLKAANGPDAEFWIANGLADKHLGWSEKLLRQTRRRAHELGWIEMITHPVKGRNALYCWGPTAKGRLT
jgi:hypothetical protein